MSWKIALRGQRVRADGQAFSLNAELDAPNGITVLAGSSGSGKSSFALGTLGLLDLEREEVRVGTFQISDAGSTTRPDQRGIACVLQDAPLFPHLTVQHNIQLSNRGTNRPENSEHWLRKTECYELRDRYPRELSGGQRQRVALARALASGPSALLLDEPFAALDAESREQLGQLLREVQREQQLPMLLITHHLADAIQLGDYLAVMESGSIVEQGLALDLLRAPQHRATASFCGLENLIQVVPIPDEREGLLEVRAGDVVLRVASRWPTPSPAKIWVGFRAEEVLLARERPDGTSARNVFAGRLTALEPTPTGFLARIDCGVPVAASVTQSALNELSLRVGDPLWCLLKASAIRVLS